MCVCLFLFVFLVFFTRSQNGIIIGLNEYTHATWLTSLNQDLASVIFWGNWKLEIEFSKFSLGVTPDDVIWRPLN